MKRFFLLVFFLIFITKPAAAKDATVAEVIATLEAGYSGLRDLQASFSQSTALVGMPRPQKGNGELMLRMPSTGAAQFRFDYAVPRQTIVCNGKQLWFYLPENRQVIASSMEDMFKGGNSIALTYLTGLGNVSKDFIAAFSKEQKDKKGNYQLDLTPRSPSPTIARLRLTIDLAAVEKFRNEGNLADTFPVLSSVVIDGSGNETRISYSRIRANKGLAAGRFNFKIPEGTELINH